MINSSGQIILTVMILYIYIYIYIYIYCDGYHHCDRTFFYRLPSTTRECEISTFFFFFQYKKGIYFSLNRLKFTATRKHHNKTKLV